MTIELDGREMTTRTAMHDHLASRLALPQSYGRNLDALYDLLTERSGCILLRNSQAVGNGGLVRVLQDAARNNPNLHIQIEP